MTYWQMALLGRLEASHGETVIHRFGTQATAGLLAHLAYFGEHWHAREVLVEALWPEVAPASGRGRLNTAVHTLRRLLDPALPAGQSVIQSTRQQLRLTPGLVETDVARFRALRRSDPAAAVELWVGPLLPGLYLDWVAGEREALTDELLTVARELHREALARDDTATALAVARRAVQADPLREESHLLVIQAALASGAADLAQRQYEQLTDLLARELGLTPSFTLRDLAATSRQRATLAAPAASPAEAPAQPGHTATVLAIGGSPRVTLGEVVQAHGGELLPAAATALAQFPTARAAWRCAQELAAGQLSLALHTSDGLPAEAARELAGELAAATVPGGIVCSASTAALLSEDRALAPAPVEMGVFRVSSQPAALAVWALSPVRNGLLRLPSGGRSNVPLVTTRFFGRQTELAELTRLLLAGTPSLVTLSGPGGSGKSRLAIQLAQQWTAEHGTPAWFVPLAPLRETSAVARRALEVLLGDSSLSGDATEQLIFELRRTPGLLVLDNLEHLPPTVAGLVQQLVARVPRLRCLLTSRQVLGIESEVELPLAPLPVMAADRSLAAVAAVPAVALFVDRARAAQPSFALTARNAPVVQDLCARLEGLPLALELAAARVQTQTPASLLASLSGKLDWAAKRRSGLPERQRTLRTTLHWSYDLLPAPLQRCLRQLSAFRGSFTAELAQEVTGDPLTAEYLAQLRGYSLVVREDRADCIRWRHLAMVREFAEELLPPRNLAAVRARHARAFVARADRLANLPEPDRATALAALGPQLDDLRAMVAWCQQYDPVRGLRVALALHPVWMQQGYWDEGASLLEQLLAATAADHPQRGPALLALGAVASHAWPNPQAAAVLDQALAWARAGGSPSDLIQALWSRAVVAGEAGEAATLAALAAEGRALAEALPGLPGRILTLDFAAMPLMWSPNAPQSIPFVESGLALSEELADPQQCLIHAMVLLGLLFYVPSRWEQARRLIARYPPELTVGDSSIWALTYRRNVVAFLAVAGEPLRAAELLVRCGSSVPRIGSHAAFHEALFMSLLLRRLDAPAEALAWLTAAWRWRQAAAAGLPFAGQQELVDREVAACRAVLTPAQQRAAEEQSRGLTMADLAHCIERIPDLIADFRRQQAAAAD
ncbi:MAG: hypothetical protein IT204_16395 [Fimbriimonadaceae bacterium]|nr:hypothetical protein [Fimbriimonadaceae bacterium]